MSAHDERPSLGQKSLMKAVGYERSLPIQEPDSLLDIEVPTPQPKGRDLLVRVKAVSVNPLDVKVRKTSQPEGTRYKILGWDAAGTVTGSGPEARLFREGDEVYYAGSISRPGTNSEFHLVDERIVGRKPETLGYEAAAAMPLTSITAWELLFDRLEVRRGNDADRRSLLVVGAAGGVGSILLQLARRLTGLTIIGTASREESQKWCLSQGAHRAIDHSRPMTPQLREAGIPQVELIASLSGTEGHFAELVETLAPEGKIALIDQPNRLDVLPLRRKSASLHWEYMMARPLFETADMAEQGRILQEVSAMVDRGLIRTTLSEVLGPISAETVKTAHTRIEAGHTQGKLVLSGF